MNRVRWVVVSEVALCESNGAGMRAILPYVLMLKTGSVASLYIEQRNPSLEAVSGVQYFSVPSGQSPFKLVRILRMIGSTFKCLKKNFNRQTSFLILPNSVWDLVLGCICRVYSPKITLWVMDDFLAAHRTAGHRIRAWFYSRLFLILYRTAEKRVVVSESMRSRYQTLSGVRAEEVLGKSLAHVDEPEKSQIFGQKKLLRLVYIGTFLDPYFEPIEILKNALESNPEFSFLKIDLYGLNAPGSKWLSPGKIEYRGKLETNAISSCLKSYDFGLLTYSSDPLTCETMALSFPSKLIDYLGASLPVVTIGPEKLSFIQEIEKREIGPVFLNPTASQDWERSFFSLLETPEEIYFKWRHNATFWAKEAFLLDKQKIGRIFPEVAS